MKYSFIIPYYKRRQFWNTLLSYRQFMQDRTDVEFLVLEDKKNVQIPEEHEFLIDVIKQFSDHLNIKHRIMNYDNHSCPCSTINYGVELAAGKYVVMTNPECFLKTDVLAGFDEELTKNDNAYVVCACMAVEHYTPKAESFEAFKYKERQWHQHTIYANRCLNFCTALTKEAYIKMWGFNEEFDKGIGRADVDFIKRIAKAMTVVPRDDLLVLHQDHELSFDPGCRDELVNNNYGCRIFRSRFKKE